MNGTPEELAQDERTRQAIAKQVAGAKVISDKMRAGLYKTWKMPRTKPRG